MSSDVAALYERLIERDLDSIPAAVRTFRESHSSDDLFLAVARFAILSYAPSQHAKHAVLATLSAHQLREAYGDRWDDLLAECARYAAESRQPWSEPPILEPPAIDRDQRRDIEALREAVTTRDRLAAERWLASRLDDEDLFRDLLLVASDDFEDFGHKVIVTAAAWRLAGILGEKGRYAALRVAVWEITSYSGERYVERRADVSNLRQRLIDNAMAEKGSIESMHLVFLYEAARDTPVFARVCDYLCSGALQRADSGLKPAATQPPIYRLARDYAQCLKAYAIGDDRLKAAAIDNLEHAPSFADWTFA
ncbi:MAG TPA: hypothetical protein VGS96_01840 [Thermoanaerobaculia bacterium]|nr:hypothetical protein [Thermoanaerobaculia bacterium]